MFEIVPQLIINSLVSGSLYALASLGLSLLYGVSGVLNFAHGQFLMTGAFLFYLCHHTLELPILYSACLLLLSLPLFAMLFVTFFVSLFRPYSPMLVLTATMTLGVILESVVALVYGVDVKMFAGSYETFDFGSLLGLERIGFEESSAYATPLQCYTVAAAISMAMLMALLIHKTSWGRKVRALSASSPAAQSIGLNEAQTLVRIAMISLGSAFLAGTLIGYESSIYPTMGYSYTFKALGAMLLGGLGNLWGTIIASYLMAVIENFGIELEWNGASIPSGYKDAFVFMVILLVLLARPQGLLGRPLRTS